MFAFENSINSLIKNDILKNHHGVNGEYIEYRILNKLPNGKKGSDHPEFELKTTRHGSQITLSDLSYDYLKSSFKETQAYEKCKSMVYIPWDVIDGKKTFINFYHISMDDWYNIMSLLEIDFANILTYINQYGIEDLRNRSSSNFASTKYLQLYRCKDRFSESKQTMVKPRLRLKITYKLFRMLLGEIE